MSPSYSFIHIVCQLLIDLETTNLMYTQEKVFKIVVVSILALLTAFQSTLISTLIGAVLGIIAACILPLA
jgi:hypothetical protein